MKDLKAISLIIVLMISLNTFHFIEIKADVLKTEAYKKAEIKLEKLNVEKESYRVVNQTDMLFQQIEDIYKHIAEKNEIKSLEFLSEISDFTQKVEAKMLKNLLMIKEDGSNEIVKVSNN